MNHLPRLILFDFDRTIGYLYRDRTVLGVLRERILEAYSSVDLDEWFVSSLSDDGYHAWHRIHEWAVAHLPRDLADSLNASAENVVATFEVERVQDTELIPDAADALRRIAHFVPLGVVSSNSNRAVDAALSRAGIRALFGYVGGRETDPFTPSNLKPHPSQLRLAIERTAIPAEAIWYVGDDVVDVVAARSAAIRAVAVATGIHTKAELRAAGADTVISSLSELATLIEALAQ